MSLRKNHHKSYIRPNCESRKKKLPQNYSKYVAKLKFWNIVAASVQFISFVGLLIAFLTNMDTYRRVSIWIVEDRGSTVNRLAEFFIAVSLLPFPAITSFFHVLALFDVDNYYYSVLIKGRNRLRWIEYSITNGLITFSLVTLAGAGDIVLAIVCVLANFVMQYFGYLHELLNHESLDGRYRSWTYLIIGFIPWVQIWLAIFVYYGINFSTAPLYESFAIIGSFILSLTFVAPLVWRFNKRPTCRNNYYLELVYILLSLSAKLYLDWTVTIGSLVEGDSDEHTEIYHYRD